MERYWKAGMGLLLLGTGCYYAKRFQRLLQRSSAANDKQPTHQSIESQDSQFVDMQVLFEYAKIQQSLAQSLRCMFDHIDKDKTGFITRTRFSVFLRQLGLTGAREATLLDVLGVVDDRPIDFDEFLSHFEASLQPSSAMLAEPTESRERAGPVYVFLGGTCGASTWRQDIAIPTLQKHGITYYNPQVSDWSPLLLLLENVMKAWCKVLLFVIGSDSRAIAAKIEAAQFLGEGRNVVLVIDHITAGTVISGHKVSQSEADDLNRSRAYLRDIAQQKNVQVFPSVSAACEHIVAIHEEELKEKKRLLAAAQQAQHSPNSSQPSTNTITGASEGSQCHRVRLSMDATAQPGGLPLGRLSYGQMKLALSPRAAGLGASPLSLALLNNDGNNGRTTPSPISPSAASSGLVRSSTASGQG